jgi:hypothetical protein
MKPFGIPAKICFCILLVLIVKNVVVNALMIGHMKDRGSTYDIMPKGTVPPQDGMLPPFSVPFPGSNPSQAVPMTPIPESPPVVSPPIQISSEP